MSFRDATDQARGFLREARAMLDSDLDYISWAEGFGQTVSKAVDILATAGVRPTREGVRIGDSRDALREALDRADALLDQAGADDESVRLDRQLDSEATFPDGNHAQEAYDICDGVIASALRIRNDD
jgi:hypothetical protein